MAEPGHRGAQREVDGRSARWFDTPWVGNPKTVVGRSRNSGDLLCKGVVVDFFAIEFTTGDGPMIAAGE